MSDTQHATFTFSDFPFVPRGTAKESRALPALNCSA